MYYIWRNCLITVHEGKVTTSRKYLSTIQMWLTTAWLSSSYSLAYNELININSLGLKEYISTCGTKFSPMVRFLWISTIRRYVVFIYNRRQFRGIDGRMDRHFNALKLWSNTWINSSESLNHLDFEFVINVTTLKKFKEKKKVSNILHTRRQNDCNICP